MIDEHVIQCLWIIVSHTPRLCIARSSHNPESLNGISVGKYAYLPFFGVHSAHDTLRFATMLDREHLRWSETLKFSRRTGDEKNDEGNGCEVDVRAQYSNRRRKWNDNWVVNVNSVVWSLFNCFLSNWYKMIKIVVCSVWLASEIVLRTFLIWCETEPTALIYCFALARNHFILKCEFAMTQRRRARIRAGARQFVFDTFSSTFRKSLRSILIDVQRTVRDAEVER